ncbi:MAG: hypothetical protein EA379_06385 [Phycisphaerales bacterium]|nr:MAG: hypothetical protein EA379_06385 [Phycisphaerales bacterium]
MKINPLLPSMFHRRLALLYALMVVAFLPIGAKLGWLTVVRGDELRAEAERALVRHRWTPTVRGHVLDRKGRVLAQDTPGFDIAVDYEVITEEWALRQATADARAANRDAWLALSLEQRELLIAQSLPEHERALQEMWDEFARVGGVDRATIDARKGAILAEVRRVASSVWARAREQRQEELTRRARRPVEVSLAEVVRPIREQRQAHVILRNVDDGTAFAFRRLSERMPGVRVIDAGARQYPYETMRLRIARDTFPAPVRTEEPIEVELRGVATHALGWMRERVFAEDIERRPMRDRASGAIDRGHYQVGDHVGQSGVEAAMEDSLRGLRGQTTLHLDTGEREETPAEPGHDVRLTIDIALQARVQALMTPEVGLAQVAEWHREPTLPIGSPLNGAAVVLDVQTGEILAMVTTPTFTREDLRDRPDAIFNDPVNNPWVNRAIGAPYPPGSIAKAPLILGAVTSGAHRLGHAIECTGHFLPNRRDVFRCWIYKQFNTTHTARRGGALHAPEALSVSCNIYFYTIGRALGPSGVEEWYRNFGVGEGWGLGIGPESGGFLGRIGGAPLDVGDAINMGIGQGPVAWTPLHAADAYATIARGGLRIVPRIRTDAPAHAEDLRLDPEAMRQTLEGLRMAVTERDGTGSTLTHASGSEPIFNVPGLRVYGKTGTAQAPAIWTNDANELVPAGTPGARLRVEGDHSWFVVLVGEPGATPRYSIAVMMEYAGSGGRVSGPIANQIIHALVEEGYLPRVDALAGRAR